MSCETDLSGINSNTSQISGKADTTNSLLVQIRDSLGSSGGDVSGTSEDYLHDMVVLLASLHQQVTGDLPAGLITVGGA